MNFNGLNIARCAARVTRVHTVPTLYQQSVGEHTFGMLMLARLIVAPRQMSVDLMEHILLHDVPEAVTGDVPGPTLRSNLDLRNSMDVAEAVVRTEFDINTAALSDWERDVYVFCDKIEFGLFAMEEVYDGNFKLLPRIKNCIDGVMSNCYDKVTPNAEKLVSEMLYRYDELAQHYAHIGSKPFHGWPK